MDKNIWYIAGRELKGREVKSYLFKNYDTNREEWVKHRSAPSFINKHEVLNCTCSANQLSGVGVQLKDLPKYEKDKYGRYTLIGGMSPNNVLALLQPKLQEYNAKQETVQGTNSEKNKSAKLDYIVTKLNLITNLVDLSIQMKDITNGLAENGELTRYLKQIDIDNVNDVGLGNIVRYKGVNGLADGLKNRIQLLKARAIKYLLGNEQIDGKTVIERSNELIVKCDEIRKLHLDTKRLIAQANQKQNTQKAYSVLYYIRKKNGALVWELETQGLNKENTLSYATGALEARGIFNNVLGIRAYEVPLEIANRSDVQEIMQKGTKIFDKAKTQYADLKRKQLVIIERNPNTYQAIGQEFEQKIGETEYPILVQQILSTTYGNRISIKHTDGYLLEYRNHYEANQNVLDMRVYVWVGDKGQVDAKNRPIRLEMTNTRGYTNEPNITAKNFVRMIEKGEKKCEDWVSEQQELEIRVKNGETNIFPTVDFF